MYDEWHADHVMAGTCLHTRNGILQAKYMHQVFASRALTVAALREPLIRGENGLGRCLESTNKTYKRNYARSTPVIFLGCSEIAWERCCQFVYRCMPVSYALAVELRQLCPVWGLRLLNLSTYEQGKEASGQLRSRNDQSFACT